MTNLRRGVFREDVGVGRDLGDVGSTVVTGDAVLLVHAAQLARRAAGIVRRVAGDAGVGANGGVTAQRGLRGDFAAGVGVDASGPSGERVDGSAELARRVMTSEAELAAGAVFHQEVQRNGVLPLHVRIVTGGALHVALDELYGMRRVCCLSAGGQGGDQMNDVLKGQCEANGVRGLETAAKDIGGIHRTLRHNFSVSGGLADCHCAVVAAQAHVACRSKDGLRRNVFLRGAAVERVHLGGELLIPEPDVLPRVRGVTVGAGIRPSAGDGRFAAGSEIVHAHRVAENLREDSAACQQEDAGDDAHGKSH